MTIPPEDLWPSYCDPLYEMPSSIDVKVTLEQGTLDQGDYTFQVAIIKAAVGSKAYFGKRFFLLFLLLLFYLLHPPLLLLLLVLLLYLLHPPLLLLPLLLLPPLLLELFSITIFFRIYRMVVLITCFLHSDFILLLYFIFSFVVSLLFSLYRPSSRTEFVNYRLI